MDDVKVSHGLAKAFHFTLAGVWRGQKVASSAVAVGQTLTKLEKSSVSLATSRSNISTGSLHLRANFGRPLLETARYQKSPAEAARLYLPGVSVHTSENGYF